MYIILHLHNFGRTRKQSFQKWLSLLQAFKWYKLKPELANFVLTVNKRNHLKTNCTAPFILSESFLSVEMLDLFRWSCQQWRLCSHVTCISSQRPTLMIFRLIYSYLLLNVMMWMQQNKLATEFIFYGLSVQHIVTSIMLWLIEIFATVRDISAFHLDKAAEKNTEQLDLVLRAKHFVYYTLQKIL